MTLHEAIIQVLKSERRSLHADEIAQQVNLKHLYERGDKQPVTGSQIMARVRKYGDIFSLDGKGLVSLQLETIVVLRHFVSKLQDFLQTKGLHSGEVGVVIPSVLLLLRFGQLTKLQSFNAQASGLIATKDYELVESFLEKGNHDPRFNGVFDKAVDILLKFDASLGVQLSSLLKELDINLINSTVSDKEFGSFFSEVLNDFTWSNVLNGGVNSTPKFIINLVKELVELNVTDVVFDPYIGKGSLIAEIVSFNDNRYARVIGGDVLADNVLQCKMNMLANRITNFNVDNKDAFIDWKDSKGVADWFIANPPISAKETMPEHTYSIVAPYYEGNLFYLFQAIYHTKATGKAIVVLPESSLYSQKPTAKAVRKQLLEDNLLDAVITLPGEAFQIGFFDPVIVILNKQRTLTGDDKVFFYDFTRNKEKNPEYQIASAANAYLHKEPLPNEASVFSRDELIAKDYELNVQRLIFQRFIATDAAFVRIKQVVLGLIYPKHIDAHNINTKEGVPILSVHELSESKSDFIIDETKAKLFLSDTELVSGAIRYLPYNAILLARGGSNLKPSLYKGGVAIGHRSILVLQLDESKMLPEYFVLQLFESYMLEQMGAARLATTITSIDGPSLLNLSIKLVPLAEQRRIIEQHFRSLAATRQGNKELRYLVGELKHKVKGPLGGLDAGLKMLESFLKRKEASGQSVQLSDVIIKRLPSDKEEYLMQYSLLEVFKRLSDNIKRIDDHIKRTDMYARLGNTAIEMEAVNLYRLLVEEVIPNYRNKIPILLAAKKRVARKEVLVNRELLKVVFENLIENAMIHGFKEQVKAGDKINIELREQKGERNGKQYIEVIVENNGEPLPPNFTIEDFTTDGKTTNGKKGSTGIGGALVAKALNEMEGRLTGVVNSSDKLGVYNTQFIFLLPLA